jgi:DNA-binding NtrC family response regulator
MKPVILVVDDDDSVRASLEKLLEAEGYHVLTARDGEEALDRFESERASLVVMDVNLGPESGWETLKRVTALNGSVPTVIITAEIGQRERAEAAGAAAFIEKPIDVEDFLSIVERLLATPGTDRTRRAPGEPTRCRSARPGGHALLRNLEERYSRPLDTSWFERVCLTPGGGVRRRPGGPEGWG